MPTIINGIVGGLVATVVMTAVKVTVGPSGPPPTAALWAQYVGDGEPPDYKQQGMILHFLYGAIAGAIYVPVFTAFNLGMPISTWVGGIVWGAIWGILLFVVAAAVWVKGILGMEPESGQAAFMAGNHVVYGVVLGAWVVLGLL